MSARAETGARVSMYRVAGITLLLAGTVVALIVALLYGGGAAPLLTDAGPLVRWGLPTVRALNNIAAAVMVGSLVLALFALRPDQKPFGRALDIASAGAAVFTITAGVTGFLTFMVIFAPELSADRQFGDQLGRFLVTLPLGQAWLITTLLGAVITVLVFAWRTWTPVLLTTVLAVAALIPVSTQGHSGDLAGHTMAVNSIFLHTLAAAVWLGGLILVVLLRGAGVALEPLVRRYSSLALAAFLVLAVSGVARSLVGIGGWEGLWTSYGVIILAKAVLLGAMGLLGAWYRARLIPRFRRGERWFWLLVLAELTLMGLASGAAAALARTPPPTGEAVYRTDPAEILLKRPAPPEFTLDRWLTGWHVDILWVVACGFGLFFYIAGVLRLRRRGDSWPLYRTVLWVGGILALFWVTSGPLNEYQAVLFSAHMLGHMALGMAIPMLLVFGAPVTLALRAIRKRDDGTRGGREWILWAVHSPYSKILTHPIVAGAIFILSLWAFYFSDLVRWATKDHLGHEWMVAHFLIAGYLFTLSLVGIDPVPYRLPYAGRLLMLIVVMAMHAFFGMAIMMQSGLMVAEWYGAMGRTWGPTPMEDQYIGGGIAWSVGELPTLILAVTVAIQWSRSDERIQRTRDRHADRTGEAELAAYNERLSRLAARDRRD